METVGTLLNRARQLVTENQWPQAEPIYQQLVAAVPQAAELWHEFGVMQLRAGDTQAACASLQQAAAIDPAKPSYHVNLGTAFRTLKRYADAVGSYRRALEIAPPSAEVYNNLALALKDSGQVNEALAAFDNALALRPSYANGHFNRANLLLDEWRLTEAIEGYQNALAIQPSDADAYCKLGIAYYDLGRLDDALAAFDAALARQPGSPEAHRNRGLVLLSQGRLNEGWPEYAWRSECAGFGRRPFTEPRWDGSPLNGRRLLVYPEQGTGDTLHFLRYVPRLELAGGQVLLDAPPALVPLLEQSGFGRWLVRAGALPAFNIHCTLLSLPDCLDGGRLEPFWPGPYLHASEQLVARWQTALSGIAGLKVGIAWAGSPNYSHDRLRSVPLAAFGPLAQVPGVRLISLQKGRQEEIAAAEQMEIVSLEGLDESAGAFMDTTAVMKNLDLVITVDTAIGHVAGALGVPVWLALQISPDWRWQAQGELTAWYPSMRLFRQTAFNDWPPVFARMASELSRLAAAG